MIPANFWKEVTADKSCYTPQKLYNMSSKRKYIEPNPLIFRGQKNRWFSGVSVAEKRVPLTDRQMTPLRFPQKWHQLDHHQADHHQSPHHLRDVG